MPGCAFVSMCVSFPEQNENESFRTQKIEAQMWEKHKIDPLAPEFSFKF
jgi:hypothetical protein